MQSSLGLRLVTQLVKSWDEIKCPWYDVPELQNRNKASWSFRCVMPVRISSTMQDRNMTLAKQNNVRWNPKPDAARSIPFLPPGRSGNMTKTPASPWGHPGLKGHPIHAELIGLQKGLQRSTTNQGTPPSADRKDVESGRWEKKVQESHKKNWLWEYKLLRMGTEPTSMGIVPIGSNIIQ